MTVYIDVTEANTTTVVEAAIGVYITDFIGTDISVEEGQKIILDGASGDTYLSYNPTSSKVELFVNGVKKASWG